MAEINSNMLPGISNITEADTFILDNATLTGKITAQQLLDWIEANGDFLSSVGISDVNGLQAALDAKADVVHTHLIADITGLQALLDTKYDSNTAGITGNVIIIGSGSLDVAALIDARVQNITGTAPVDGRIPTTVENQFLIGGAGTDYALITSTQLKAILELNNVDNTADIDKPISTATQNALDLKQDISDVFSGDYNDLTNTPTTITTEQSDAIDANTLKRSYPIGDENKLATIEAGADVTDTVNVDAAIGIDRADGSFSRVLSERGFFVNQPTGGGGTGGTGTVQISDIDGLEAVFDTATGDQIDINTRDTDQEISGTKTFTTPPIIQNIPVGEIADENAIGLDTDGNLVRGEGGGTGFEDEILYTQEVTYSGTVSSTPGDSTVVTVTEPNGSVLATTTLRTSNDIGNSFKGNATVRGPSGFPADTSTDRLFTEDRNVVFLPTASRLPLNPIFLQGANDEPDPAWITWGLESTGGVHPGVDKQTDYLIAFWNFGEDHSTVAPSWVWRSESIGIDTSGTDTFYAQATLTPAQEDINGDFVEYLQNFNHRFRSSNDWNLYDSLYEVWDYPGQGTAIPIATDSIEEAIEDINVLINENIQTPVNWDSVDSSGTIILTTDPSLTDFTTTGWNFTANNGGGDGTITFTVGDATRIERLYINNASLGTQVFGYSLPTEDPREDGRIFNNSGFVQVSEAVDTFSARLTLTNNITGPSEGYTITSDTLEVGETGDSWTLSASVTLNSGYVWDVEPTDFSETGVFGSSNVNRTHTLTGTVREVALSGIVLDDLAFTAGVGETGNITVSGDVGVSFNLAVVNTNPTGWITSGALGATSGTIPADGTFETTLVIPTPTADVNRTGAITATNSNDPTNIVTSGLFRQLYTVPVADGDLAASSSGIIVGGNFTVSVNITAGDPDFTIQLFDTNPSTGSPAAIETLTGTAIGAFTFTSIDVSEFAVGEYSYYVRISDSDGDIVNEIETFTIQDSSAYPDSLGFDGKTFWLDGSAFRTRGYIPVIDGYTSDDWRVQINGNERSVTASNHGVTGLVTFNEAGITTGTFPYTVVDRSDSPSVTVETGNLTFSAGQISPSSSSYYISPPHLLDSRTQVTDVRIEFSQSRIEPRAANNQFSELTYKYGLQHSNSSTILDTDPIYIFDGGDRVINDGTNFTFARIEVGDFSTITRYVRMVLLNSTTEAIIAFGVTADLD